MILFSQLVVAKNNPGRPPHVRAALSGRHQHFMQCGWSDTGTGSQRGCAIAIFTQNLTREDLKMQNYPCFKWGLRPRETF